MLCPSGRGAVGLIGSKPAAEYFIFKKGVSIFSPSTSDLIPMSEIPLVSSVLSTGAVGFSVTMNF